MSKLKVGVRLESLGVPLRRALQEAERMGVTGVQVDAVGELAPQSLSHSGRQAFRHLLRSHNLELTALGCPLRHGLDVAADLEQRLDQLKEALSLSVDLGPRIAVVQAGQIPEAADDPRAALLAEALQALGKHGNRIGATLALETGLEPGQVLSTFLDSFDTGGLGINLDPANLLIAGFDPYEGARALHGRVVHSHAKDARQAAANRAGLEVPLGQGDMDWARYVGVLEEIGYRGWLVVEREDGDRRLADVVVGVEILRRFVLENGGR